MTALVSSVRVEPVGAHESVVVYVKGQCVGNLVVGTGDGAPLRSLLIAQTTDAPSHDAQSQPAPAPDYQSELGAEAAEEPEPCSCEEALALKAQLQAARTELGRLKKPKGALPWRTGRRVSRTIYDRDDALIGVMDTAELAALAVEAVNAQPAPAKEEP